MVRTIGKGRIFTRPKDRSEGRFITFNLPSCPANPMMLLPPPSMFVAVQQPSSFITVASSCIFIPSL